MAVTGRAGTALPRVVDRLGLTSGISNGYVLDILHDDKGYTWIATEDGLNRYDGYEFRTFTTADGLSGDKLNSICLDAGRGCLWIATQYDGLDCLDLATYEIKTYRHNPDDSTSIADDYITSVSLASDHNGLWVTTYWDGLDYLDLDSGRFVHHNTKTIMDWPSNKTWCVAESPYTGELYIGLDVRGMMIYDPKTGKTKHYTHNPADPSSIPANQVRSILIDRGGNVWVGTSRGLALFNPSSESFSTVVPSCQIYDLMADADGKVWAACENRGIAIVDPSSAMLAIGAGSIVPVGSITAGKTAMSLSCKTVHALSRDAFGNIFAGTYGDGVDIMTFRPRSFTTWSDSEGTSPSLTDKNVMTILYNPGGKEPSLWIGTDGYGIDVVGHNGMVRNVSASNSILRDNAVTASYLDPADGSMWFGTYCGQLLRVSPDGMTMTDVPVTGNVTPSDIRDIVTDSRGNLYIGHAAGISVKAPGGEWRHYTPSTVSMSMPEMVRTLHIDRRGRLYAGSHGAGIQVYDSVMNHLTSYAAWENVPRKLPFNFVNHIVAGQGNDVWAATDRGLVKIITDRDSVRIYGRAEGLSDTKVRAIALDSGNCLWLSTSSGIMRFDPDRETFRAYGPGDGTADGDFTIGSAALGMSLSDSVNDGETVFFGSHYGLTQFSPGRLADNPEIPGIRFTDIMVYGSDSDIPRHVNPDREIKLDYRDNTLRVSFSVMDPVLARGVDYYYMLEGQGDSWFDNGGTNYVVLRNLRPGSYRLRVMARHAGTTMADAPESSIEIVVESPLWATWWAKGFYGVIALLFVYFVIAGYKRHLKLQNTLLLEQQNHRREQEVNDERMRFFTNITHELRTPLSLIIGPLRDMEENPQLPQREMTRVTMMRKSADRLLSMVNSILEFRKTETQNKQLAVHRGNLADLVREMGDRYRELNTNRSVEYETVIEDADFNMLFDLSTMSTILDNLLSNAAKYTDEGRITLSLSHDTGTDGTVYAAIKVADTGSGIRQRSIPHIFERYYHDPQNTHTTSTGIGLALVKNLVELHEGTVSVESREGEGSVFTVRLRVDNTYPRAIHDTAVAETVEEIYTPEMLDDRESPKSKPVILVVEDNKEICSYIADSLADSYIVHIANDGVAGLEKAATLVPDIIVSDIMMPRMDGMEMVRKLKSDVNTSHIPVILLTAKGSIEDRTDAYSIGAESFITKPFTSRLLRSRIGNILEARRLLTDRINGAPRPDEKARVLAESVSQIDREFLEKLESLIDADPATDTLDVTYLASKMNMSHSSLYRKVKALTGMSVNGFIRYKRIHRAEELLLTGRHTISEIAMMVGINSLSNFRTIFKEEFGMTPSEYLASKRMQN